MATTTKKKTSAKNRIADDNGTKTDVETAADEKQRKKGEGLKKQLTISAPNFETAEFEIVGNTPYVMNRFGAKAIQQMREAQEAGSTAKKGKKRPPKDFAALFQDSMHRDENEGWVGLPANSFRNAMISACKIVGFAMTRAKLSVFVEADGFGQDGTPLIKLEGKPEHFELPVRQQQTCDIRVRAKFQPGWKARVRIRYDADQFTIEDVTNLLVRVGVQVGLGEGRPDSKASAGMGWGLFDVASK